MLSTTVSKTEPGEQPQSTDPMPIGTLGMWLFIASESMFFIVLLGASIVLKSAGPERALFIRSAQMLSGWIGLGSVVLLLLSSAAVWLGGRSMRWFAVAVAVLFLGLQAAQWQQLLGHHTVVSRDGGRVVVADGTLAGPGYLIRAHQIDLPANFDIHRTTAADFLTGKPGDARFGEPVLLDLNYGPSRNNFFGGYFLMTALHGVHLLGGIVALVWFMLFCKTRLPAAVQIYWHFVNGVGILGLAALYFV